MSGMRLTFSRQIKDELCTLPCENTCCQQAELAAAVYGAGRLSQSTMTLHTAHAGSAQRLANLILNRYGEQPVWQTGRELAALTVTSRQTLNAIDEDLSDVFGVGQKIDQDLLISQMPTCCKHAVLRALFLACGSVSEPAAAYHLELAIHRPEAASMASSLLLNFEIRTGLVNRHGYWVLYIKEGQHIADYLLLSGAHQSLLDFESLRVEKEMRNSVNRMVNCDSANTQRIADTAARQLDLIRQLNDVQGLSLLSEDLLATAKARLENPDLSLRELGETMQPPLGKSGMNHRLKRLEQAAAELLDKRRIR